MQLTSIYFFLFSFIVIVLFYITPSRHRWLILLIASAFFYLTWSSEYLFFALASVGLNFYLGKKISAENSKEQRRIILLIGIFTNLFALIFFKYSNDFFGELHPIVFWKTSVNLSSLSNSPPPIGISFYTLQMTAYLLDIYSNIQKSETHIGRFALFAIFFPTQVSGPIERAKNLLPQFSKDSKFNSEEAREGLKRIGWGVFKKLVIANRLGIYVDAVFNNPADFYGFPAIVAVLFFAFQLYCDFSGYTDIVLGIARILGYKLTENFTNPYFSNSIQKFWNNWHISLSTWLRDYIFFPLRRSLIRTKYSHTWFVMLTPPFLTMLISGLWHGEGWTYLIWGMIHGIYLFGETLIRPAIDSFFEKRRSKIISGFYQFICILLTFFLVCFGWIFFRANSIEDAFQLLGNIKELNWTGYQLAIQKGGVDALIEPFVFDGGLNKENFILSVLLIGFLLGAELAYEKFDLGKKFNTFATPVRWLFYCGAIFAIVMLSADNSTQNFIYFKF